MNPPLKIILVLCAAVLALLSEPAVRADQNIGRPLPEEQDSGVFGRASRSIGGFFHRLFNPGDDKAAPKHSNSQRAAPRHKADTRNNLDRPPPLPSVNRDEPPARPHTSEPGPKPKQDVASSHKPAKANVEEAPKQKPKSKPRSEDASTIAANEHVREKPRSEPPPHTEPPKPASGPETPPETQSKPPEKPADNSRPPPKQDSPSASSKVAQEQSVQTGTKTGKPGRVKSPYPPHSELDVSGLPSGSLALDPTTQKVFRVP